MDIEFTRASSDCLEMIKPIFGIVEQLIDLIKEMGTRDGISLLEVKNHDTIAYLRDLTYLMWNMVHGYSITGNPAIERLVYLRTILERIRPIEEKLKPQIEKLSTIKDKTSENNLRPRPELLKFDQEGGSTALEEGIDSDDGEQNEQSAKKYIPPKVVAVHYNEEEENEEEKRIEKARRRALQSSLIQDLRSIYTNAPEEMMETDGNPKKRMRDLQRERYEEDYMVRLQMTKKEKHNKRIERRQNILDDLLNFGDYMALDENGKSKPKLGSKMKTKGKPKLGSKMKTKGVKKSFKKTRKRG